MLLKEKLEDQAIKKAELDRTLVEKKLELMATLQRKLASVGRTDDKLDREIKTLADQVAAWRAADEAKAPKAKKPLGLKVIPESAAPGGGSSQSITQSTAKSGPAK
jgi:hypothetical protein